MKSHRNVLETFDELPALPRPPTRAMRNGRTWANSGGAASHSLRPAFKGSGRHRRSGSPPSSVVPHPRTSHQPVPHRPPTRPPSHPPSRGRERGPRDPSLRPTPGMARSAEELFTDLTAELMFGVRLGSQDDLADGGAAATIPRSHPSAPFRHRIGLPRLSAPRSPPLFRRFGEAASTQEQLIEQNRCSVLVVGR